MVGREKALIKAIKAENEIRSEEEMKNFENRREENMEDFKVAKNKYIVLKDAETMQKRFKIPIGKKNQKAVKYKYIINSMNEIRVK